MDKRTKICIWVIVLGLVNFFAYTLIYVFINGEAISGQVIAAPDGEVHYLLQSDTEVSRAVYIYSGIHSISIWPTVAAVMLAMLTLAKDRIVSAMHSTVVRGRTFITILATIITFTTIIITVWFILQFTRSFSHAEADTSPQDSRRTSPPSHVAAHTNGEHALRG